jgi:hypothetical protein
MVKLKEHYNAQIRAGLVTPDMFGNQGSYANGQSNSANSQVIINNITKQILETVMNQFVRPVLDNAVGYVEDYGHFTIKDNSLDDAAIWQKLCEGGAKMGILDISDLNDVNIMREKISFPPKDEISEDMLMQANPLRGTNVNKTKQEVGKPYSNGLKTVTKNTYGKS